MAFPLIGKVLVEGVNLRKKHQRKTKANQKGQVIEKAMPINASKVMLFDSAKNKGTRVGYKIIGEKKVRISVKSGKEM